LLLLGVLGQLLQIGDQIVQLRHLDISLNHIRWIQVTDRLLVLLDSLLVIPLRVELVSVFLANLSDDVGREACVICDLLGFLK